MSSPQLLPLLPAGTNVWPRGQNLSFQAPGVVGGSSIQLCTTVGSLGEAAKHHSIKSFPSAVTKTPSKSCYKAQALKPIWLPLQAETWSCPHCGQELALISPNKCHLPTSPAMPRVRKPSLGTCPGYKYCILPWKFMHTFPTRKSHHPLIFFPEKAPHTFSGTKQMELSFHLLDVPLPHLSPTFEIYIYKTRNPAEERLTGSKWIPRRHVSRGPHSAWAWVTQSRKRNWHPIFYPFLSPWSSLLFLLTFSKIRIQQTEIHLFVMAQEAS